MNIIIRFAIGYIAGRLAAKAVMKLISERKSKCSA